ncbi:hypothetical protein CQW23_25062 [Capsicum baccatum]|uniref:Disease resistance protein winged helix domain-containing protein n=1 Tax=Capsicum baccatum TaxID=33114 RepID=A0A2G2VWL2_CAPBA|nr:hypothetical protein CQW23_25062 [Capsicum baccatum]
MEAYIAVISLLQILEQFQERHPVLIQGQTAKTLESLHNTAEYFQNFLEEASKSRFDPEKIKSIKEIIISVVSDAEDVIEMCWTWDFLIDSTSSRSNWMLQHLEDDIVQGLDEDLGIILEHSWKLLCAKVFGPEYDHPPELEEIGKQIAEKCQGLPLTISVIAGHLSKVARTLESWMDVSRTMGEIIASHPDKFLGVLGLSYHNLPNHLKPFFLSIGSFPEDYQVETWRLIQLWIAEGFIRRPESDKSLEEVEEDYCRILSAGT